MDGKTDAQKDNRQKVTTIAHPEHSSDELKMLPAAVVINTLRVKVTTLFFRVVV